MPEVKNALITGASSGLGEALAFALAEKGHNLTLTARRLDKLVGLRDQLLKINKKIDILIAKADVSIKAQVEETIKNSVAHFGALDYLIANAGQGMWTRFSDLGDPDELNDLMQLNYMGVVYSLFYALPHLRKNKGSFVAISSIQGVIPVAYHTGYVASKYAVNGLIDTIRLEEPDVHFLLALPMWISGTELRSHALVGHNAQSIKVKTTHGKQATSAQDCAKAIVEAVLLKKNEIYIPGKYRFVPILRNLFKKTFDQVVMNKIKTQLKS